MKRRLNPHLSLIFATFVLLRGFIPVGFMPNVDALKNGAIDIVVCTGVGFSTIHVDDGSSSPTHSSGNYNMHTICPFLGVMAAALLLALVISIFIITASCRVFAWVDQSYRPSCFNRSAPPRGPPLAA